MLIDELRKRARSLVQVPPHLQLVIEDYMEVEDGKGNAMFSWINEEQKEDISINLDSAGNLLRLTINLNDSDHSDRVPLTLNEKKERAEQFLLSHYPSALENITFYTSKTLIHAERFYFEQIVMDLPLNRSGCYIDVDQVGNIVRFTYDGVKPIPEIPTKLVSKEKLIQDVQNRLHLQLTITNVHTNLHDVEKDELRLVYEPKQTFLQYKADVLEPTLTIINEEEYEETYIPISPPKSTTNRENLTIEDVIGIPEEMEVIRKVDMGEELGIVWREKDNALRETNPSLDGFFKSRSEHTVKAFISKKSGRVRSFIWFAERRGPLQLSREECYQKAVDFLAVLTPDFLQHLSLLHLNHEDEDDDTNNVKEAFTFQINNGHGIPLHSGLVMVAVNRKTGQIDYYNGPSLEIEQLSQIPEVPNISKEEASEIYLNHLDFEMEWDTTMDNGQESNTLMYKACNRLTKTPIRYIDATTGAIISGKLT